MKQTISLQELIAVNNPSKAKALVVKYGYRPARSYNDLIQKLFILTKEHREDALKDLVEIHPHKDLILHYSMPLSVENETKSNCDGDNLCASCKSKREQFVNFEGLENTSSNSQKKYDLKELLPIIAITSLVTTTLVIALKSAR
jgi:hypothetical protein